MAVERVKTIIIGGGQAGLATSYFLKQRGVEHILLEKGQVGQSWRSKRWDSFTLVTVNAMLRLPGYEYAGDNPEGFMPRLEVINYLEGFADSFHAPLRCGVEVKALKLKEEGGFRLECQDHLFEAEQVVVATGGFQVPQKASFCNQLPPDILQITSEEYRNPQLLPGGGVLVVGSGQSGAQIAEELQAAGRKVYLAVGSAGRIPRRYRGKDINWWMKEFGSDKTAASLPGPAARFGANPHLSGQNGGHEINLRKLGQQGMILLGHLRGTEGGKLLLEDDLEQNLLRADQFAANFKKGADQFAYHKGFDFPLEDNSGDIAPGAGHSGIPVLELNLREAGITTIIWAAGYRLDFSWIPLPIFDEFGYPYHQRGVSVQEGLFFIGLPWLHRATSSLLVGVTEDAAYIAAQISAAASISTRGLASLIPG